MSRPLLESQYPEAFREKQLLEELVKKIGVEREALGDGPVPAAGYMSISRMQQVTGQMKRVLTTVQALQSALEEHKKAGTAAPVWDSRVKRMVTECRLIMSEARQLIADQQGKTNYLTTGSPSSNRRTDDEELARESSTLDESLTMINHALQSGRESVYRLKQQNFTLKGANRKVRNMLQSAGVSQAVIMTIERRLGLDRVIVVSGMLIVSLLIYLFFCYWKAIPLFWFLPRALRP